MGEAVMAPQDKQALNKILRILLDQLENCQ
jgi:hypothetical protein